MSEASKEAIDTAERIVDQIYNLSQWKPDTSIACVAETIQSTIDAALAEQKVRHAKHMLELRKELTEGIELMKQLIAENERLEKELSDLMSESL